MTERENNLTDPMDKYSLPVKREETLLGEKFTLEPRDNPEKPGRELRVLFDERFKPIEEFHLNYAYTVRFEDEGSEAGNHYHAQKSELFYPVTGSFEVHLENPGNKQAEIVGLDANNHEVFYIRSGLAHKVVSKEKGSVLLVLATSPNSEEDEFSYVVQVK